MKLYALIILIGATMHANAQAGSTVSKTFNGVKSLPTSTSMRMHEEKEGNILFLEETGKEGYFKYDRKDKVSLDNEGTVIVSRTGKRYKRVYDGNLSVAWFGAKGDGKTDDTQAFIKAIASGSNVIYIPYKAGGYRISNVPVNRTVTLKGDNKFNTIIRPAANNVSCFVTQNQFVEYHHLYFDGTGTTNTVGIEHKHRISTINSCFFSGFQKGIFNNKNFVEGGKPDEQIIINSRFRSCEYGIYSDGHFINSKILNSIFHGCTRSAIFCTDNSYLASTLTTEGLLIERCLVYDSGDPLGNTAAVDIRNLDFTFIRNCMFDINNHTALSLLNSQNCNLSGTYFSAAMAMGPSSSAKITGNCSNSTIEGCQFYDSKNWGLELT
ncbi:MAG: hypothetical protein JWQ96_2798, partial [Segetibacter sp.]|nr:hypothetical protein [Segetibacter sp.]